MRGIKVRVGDRCKADVEWCATPCGDVLLAESRKKLLRVGNVFDIVCRRRKLRVNADKNKAIVFRKPERN